MRFHRKHLVGVIGAALLLGAAAVAYVATARPRAEVAETAYDFGVVNEDQRPSHTFLIHNRGRRPLEIKEVKADCACTATNYDRVIPPGGQGALTLAIKPFSLKGTYAKKTTVTLNDPDLPKVVFTLKGVSRPVIEVQPGLVIRFRGKAGEERRQQVRLISNLPESWEIRGFKVSTPQFLEAAVTPEEPGRTYVLEVRQTRQEAGRYQAVIEVFTTVPQRPRLVLRVFGEILPQ